MMTPDEIARGLTDATCPDCNGDGWIAVSVPRCCQRAEYDCGGRGCVGPYEEQEQEPCVSCQGSGEYQEQNNAHGGDQ